MYGRPEQVFTQAWNLMVSKKPLYQASLKRTVTLNENALVQYRAEELSRLLDYVFSLKVLDHMELQPNGKLTAVFSAGVRITL